MSKRVEFVAGTRFGRLIIISRTEDGKRGRTKYLCVCICGKETVVLANSLKTGNTLSCGCHRMDMVKKSRTTHGHTTNGRKTKKYYAWIAFKGRVNNPNPHAFAEYGGRGISYDPAWEYFEVFDAYMDEPPSPKHSLDRIDVNDDYKPGNVRWATAKEQADNKRNNLAIEYKGETKLLAVWAEEFGLNYNTLYSRLYAYGWDKDKAFTTPLCNQRKLAT